MSCASGQSARHAACRRPPQGPHRQGREPGDGAGRRRAARLGAGAVPRPRPTSTPASSGCSSRCSTCATASAVRVGVASHNLFDVAWALSLGPAADRHRHRDARGHGAGAGAGRARGRGRPAAVRPVVAARRPRGQHRLPRPAPRREHRAGELPAIAVRPVTRQRRVVATAAAVPAGDGRSSPRVDGIEPPAGSRRRPAATTASTRRSSTSPTPTGRERRTARWIVEHLDACRRQRRRADHDRSTRSRASTPSCGAQSMLRARWASTPFDERRAVLRRVGRGDGVAAAATRWRSMAHDAVKTIREGDPEVSEAIDFARYYAASLDDHRTPCSAVRRHVSSRSAWSWSRRRGTSRTRSRPGGVLAALAAGNAVVLKPAPEVRARRPAARRTVWRGRRAARRAAVRRRAPTTRSAAG